MTITEVRIKLCPPNAEKLLAYCTVTFDNEFVVRDLKVIDGSRGAFVSMPSRKLADRCGECGCKNHLRARFCNACGRQLNACRAPRTEAGRAKLYADVAHPIGPGGREKIEAAVMTAYDAEVELAQQPDYVCAYDAFESFDVSGI